MDPVFTLVAELLSVDEVDPRRSFRSLGIVGRLAKELCARLAVPVTALFDYPTPAALADHLAGVCVTPDSSAPVSPDDPIVIVSMSCRYPGGVSTPDDLWDLVIGGVDAITGFPANRGWDLDRLFDPDPDRAGTTYVGLGGFLHDADRFDPAFFDISPREAVAMNPQQRLLLELTWEAFERAGIDPLTMRGQQVGVYVGAVTQDYTPLQHESGESLKGHVVLGNTGCITSGRISYAFGLTGPALTIDTGCSASLASIHLAATALRAGECTMALAGGAYVNATPGHFTEFSKLRVLSKSGRCKPFSADADGTAWGEGAGLLLLARLSDAQRLGYPVLAVVRGSAVNSDGASNGMTAPSGLAQQRVIRAALASAGLSTSDVDVVEAHGTGTALGDPIEASALLATYGQDRSVPLLVGSLKSNIGHTQSAAGVGGVIKMVQAMRHGVVPESLHITAPTPHVDWSSGAMALATAALPWPATSRPRRAGVSGFSVSGTNAHVIVEQPPLSDQLSRLEPGGSPWGENEVPFPIISRGSDKTPWVVSAKTAASLAVQIERVRAVQADPVDIAFTLARRARFAHRAVVLGDEVITGSVTAGGIAFLFSGQGTQRADMAEELRAHPVFAAAYDEVLEHLEIPDLPVDQTGYAQPALFAFQVAAFALLESWGVRPDHLLGHSIGDLAAAHVAGVLSLPDACALVSARARLMQALPPGGAMVVVRAVASDIELVDGVEIAAINGPDSVVLSGDEDAVLALASRWKHTRLPVSHAFHSAHVEPMLDEFRSVASTLTYHEPRIPMAGDVTSPEFWVRHVRETVRFHDGMRRLRAQGVTKFVTIGPDLLTSLARAFVLGVEVDWRAVCADGRLVELPTYAFDRQRYWVEPVHKSTVERYRVEWRPLSQQPAVSGTWLVVGDASDCVTALTEHGAQVVHDETAQYDAVLSALPVDDTLRLLHRLDRDVSVWLATRGAETDPSQALVWGLGRVLGLEQPQRWGGLVDLPPDMDAAARRHLVAALSGDEDQLMIRSDGLFGARLVRAPLDGRVWRPRGTVLVTGGTGALGRHITTWLLRNGAEHVVLASRTGRPVDEPRVTVVACDLSDRAAVAALLAEHPPTAVIHAAGVDQELPLSQLTPEALREVTAAKVDGARHLDELVGEVDAFVLVSSIAGVWGVGGRAGYSAANAALIALAAARRSRGQTAAAISWGPWADGMVTPTIAETLRSNGLTPMRPADAITALGHVLDHDVVIADVDWDRFLPIFSAARPRPLLADFAPTPPTPTSTTLSRDELTDLVLTHTTTALGHTSPVPVDRPFRELGVDSLIAVDLSVRLGAALGTKLPATLVFDHPTPAAVVDHLLGSRRDSDVVVGPSDDPIAIIGMGCRYPGGVSSPDDLWELVLGEVDAITGFPVNRGWNATGSGGFLHDAGAFDASFFGITPREALAMDPQQRLLLETSWEAMERAGVDPSSLSSCGVFVGLSQQAYADHVVTGGMASVASGRIAYTFGFEGPAVTVDTACSSSLVALHLAAQSLRAGECSLALAGGATVMSGPEGFAEFARQGGLAADGRCKPFSALADGTSWSEGVGVLLLARLSEAQRLGYPVLAVVRGSAVNQDGASNGLTAPNGPAQQRVIRAALASAGLSTSDISVVEAHGTGTVLGDPIEASALLATYGQDRSSPLWLGSLKSNIGHAQAAAGVAGVIKMVQAMRHGLLPRTLHASTPSPHVDWSSGAISLLTSTVPWEGARRAAVSSFGISGTNAHVILEAPPSSPPELSDQLSTLKTGGTPQGEDEVPIPIISRGSDKTPWVVSAKTPEALAAQVSRLRAIDADPVDVGFTLARRARFEHRAVVLGDDVFTGRATSGKTAVLFPGQGVVRLGQVELFEYEVEQFRLLEAWGVKPDHLLGHSLGELVVAYVSGEWTLEQARAIVAERARLMDTLPRGVMVAVEASEEEVLPFLDGRVCLGAVNGAKSVVLSGDEDAVLALAAKWKNKRLPVARAFHSHHMDPILDEFRAVLAEVGVPRPEHWVRHVRDTVRFHDQLQRLDGVTRFIELGPKLITSLAKAYVAGAEVDWQYPGGRLVDLPTYPFQREYYWHGAESDVDGWRYHIEWVPKPDTAADLSGTWAADDPRIADVLRAHGAEIVPPELAERGLLTTTTDPRELVEQVRSTRAPLWCVTSDPMLQGLGRCLALEHPQRWGGHIELQADVARLAGVLAGDEDQVAVRPDGVHARRLVRAPRGTSTPWTPRGTALITGGTGALGMHVARWLLRDGAEHVVLVSRSGRPVDDSRMTSVACDVTDRDALEAVLNEYQPNVVVHAAGVAQDFGSETGTDFDDVLAAKVDGARHLDELVGDVDAFVLFSSIAGVWGSGGQGAYAAANAFLDALAEQRRARGLKATSVAWGPWAGGGMVTAHAEEHLRRRGLRALDPARAITALRQALADDETCVVVADVDWDTFVAGFTSTRPSPLLAAFTGTSMLDVVRAAAAAVAGHASPDAIDPAKAFRDLGFDSLAVVELRTRLAEATGRQLPATLAFEYPTPAAIADFLSGSQPAQTVADTVAPAHEPIAIVAMGCRYPGGVASPENLWRLLSDGTDAITAFPADRGWDVAGDFARLGGFVDDVGSFDASFFGISPREALAMDPQQRLLLEIAWETFERAGIDPMSLRDTDTGVFIGTYAQDYASPAAADDEVAGYVATGNATSVGSGRLAYTFGLAGPALSVDTACSSSLVAIHLAVQSLRRGECSLALAGGVSVMATPGAFVEFARQGGLAADGRCKAFSASADGTAWGEGAGILLLTRLSIAERLGYPVLAVVRGTAVNQDGASNGLTAPNGLAQQRVIRSALADAHLSTSDISVVEAHGTGTALGDPIEASALLATYGQDRTSPVWLGSVKSNIGHTQAAAGVAGVIKMVQAMRHGQLPRTLHASTPSPHVDWSSGAVSLLTSTVPWEGTRRAAVSSFGMSGTNAHLILEQPPSQAPELSDPRETIGKGTSFSPQGGPPDSSLLSWSDKTPWVVSAKTPEALAAQVEQLRAVEADPVDVGFTLARRARFEHRAVLLGDDLITGRVTSGKTAVLFPGQGVVPLGQVELFEYEVEQFRQLEAWGVKPDHLLGHSLGELVVAYVSGEWTLEQARTIVAERARLMDTLPRGVMVAVEASEEEVLPFLDGRVCLGAVNGAKSVVLSGDEDAVLALAAKWKNKRLPVARAFHSHHMDPILDEFRAVLAEVGVPRPEHWVRHVRDTVRFHDEMDRLDELGVTCFIELGPKLITSLAKAYVAGVEVDWQYPGGRLVDLPTYPFQRERYWLHAEKPLLGKGVETPQTGGWVFSSQLAKGSHPWLADHVVLGTVLVPGTALLELAVQAGAEVGCPTVEELTLEAPLVLGDVTVRVHTTVDGVDDSGRRALTVHAKQGDGPWTRHASGVLGVAPGPEFDLRAWPPADAEPVELDDFYDRLADVGFAYGPAFQGLRAAWRRGDDIYVEVAAGGPRPALLDSALHGLFLRSQDMMLPFEWRDVSVHGDGVPARVRLTGDARLEVADAAGAPVMSVGSLVLRAVSADRLSLARTAGSLFRREWTPIRSSGGGRAEVVRLASHGDDVINAVHKLTQDALELIKHRVSGSKPLVIATRSGDLAGAAVRGLVRSAQSEHPGRLVLVEVDDLSTVDGHVSAAVASGEPELAVRDGVLCVPRLVAVEHAATNAKPLRGTVLITGGMGGLGTLLAARLEAEHDVKVVVASRRNGCDVADREALARLLDGIGDLTGIVHAAGVLNDGLLESLTPDQLDAVLRPKVDGAWHLHELTKDRDLSMFVLFSSAAGVLGSPGQSAYAAANAFLDGLAEHRCAQGLPGQSLAWGLWAHGMGEHVDQERAGFTALTADDGLALFDTARLLDDAVLVPMKRRRVTKKKHAVVRSEPLSEQDMLDLVRSEVAGVLGHATPEKITPARAFQELGFDSLAAIELRNRLGASTGLRLPSTLVFAHPSPAVLAKHLWTTLHPEATTEVECENPLESASVQDILEVLDAELNRFPGR